MSCCGSETCDEAPHDKDDAVLRVKTASMYAKSLVQTLLRSKPARLRRTLVVYREEKTLVGSASELLRRSDAP